eukprot:SM000019S05012  [mRNA]  locus=s19:437352:442456:- [translate_table: standard]
MAPAPPPSAAVLEALRQQLPHVNLPDAMSRVFKEECCISFDTPRSPGGLFVDLASFLAFGRDFVAWNVDKTGHRVYLCIRQTARPPATPADLEPAAQKPTLLAIGVEGGFNSQEPELDTTLSIVLLPDFQELPFPSPELPEKVRMAVEAVLAAPGAERKAQVSAWAADKKKVSAYVASLKQLDNGVKVGPSGWQCCRCDQRDNLWLNLSDGAVLCGRRNWDGTGGNNHAVEHYEATKHLLAVKLGIITADLDAADVCSYPEDDAVVDPLLAQHLAHFGIDFSSLEKTEMTTAERELDQNLNFDWNRLQENGRNLELLSGPGYTGLANLGNSCYLASVMQILFSTRGFQEQYDHPSQKSPRAVAKVETVGIQALGAQSLDAKITCFQNEVTCHCAKSDIDNKSADLLCYVDLLPLHDAFKGAGADPTMNFNAQMAKLGHGLLSGRYSQTSKKEFVVRQEFSASEGLAIGSHFIDNEHVVQSGIPPRMLKSLVGAGHPEFASSRQQARFEISILVLLDQTLASAMSPGHKRVHHLLLAPPVACRMHSSITSTCWRKLNKLMRVNLEATPPGASASLIQCLASGKVKYLHRSDNTLSLPIPLDQATNKGEVAAYEVRKATADAAGLKIKEGEIVRPRVPLAACLASFAGEEEIHNFYSSAIRGCTTATKTTRLATFPEYLVLHMSSSYLTRAGYPGSLVPEEIDISQLRSSGQQPEEELLPEDETGGGVASTAEPVADDHIVEQLIEMGFPRSRCLRAATSTNNVGAEEAMNWLLAHMDDADMEEVERPTEVETNDQLDGKVAVLLSLGFSSAVAKHALQTMEGDVERAAEWIFGHPEEASQLDLQLESSKDSPLTRPAASHGDLPDGPGRYRLLAFISHMGTSTQCGHYVCHVRKEDKWVLFNDSKVAVSSDPPKDMGYLYFFTRIMDA